MSADADIARYDNREQKKRASMPSNFQSIVSLSPFFPSQASPQAILALLTPWPWLSIAFGFWLAIWLLINVFQGFWKLAQRLCEPGLFHLPAWKEFFCHAKGCLEAFSQFASV
jgi:divalent metal cation (Fe/Co/Zn/Cd) transporter